ncbi:hypothetical protein BDN70DRAFT_939317 [Pholiota conissans]|uniref:Uncharacterized protein n=1 Tax=Pholiota conissans TaxID=109636 RepID=A0A9P5YL64_9AGAR|nr:hypothetical protein BDN70DRAFT_939317 [Pholiota conissans]
MQLPQINVNPTKSSNAGSTSPPLSTAGSGPLTNANTAASLTVAASTTAASTVAASATAATNVDPFIDDDAMDIDEEILQPNYSLVRPPHPIELVQPLADTTDFFVITVGQPIGIVTDIGNIDMRAQTQFAVTHFCTWYGAVGFYTMHFYSGHVRLVPVNTTPPDRRLVLHRITHTDSTVPTAPPPAGSASNPIFIGTPVAAAGPAGPIPLAATPTPMNQTSRWKGKGRAIFRTPVKYRPIPPKSTALRIRKQVPPTCTIYISDSDSDNEATTAKAPSTNASIIDSAIDADVAPPLDPTVASVAGTTTSGIDNTDGAIEAGGAEDRGVVVHGSDDEGPGFLPNYPQRPTSTSAPEQSAPGTPSGTPRASPAASEIPATPVRYSPSARMFVPLFSDGSDTGPRLDLSHILRSGKRFRLTPQGRSLAVDGADPLSPLTPLTPSTVHSVHASPIAGPSQAVVHTATVVAPLAGPSHQIVSHSASPHNVDDNIDDNDDASVSTETEYRISEIGDIEAVGRVMDEVYIKWKESESK